jgi:hypothetical protein
MTVNVSAFTGVAHPNCACYKCRVKKELDGFGLWYGSISNHFGGIVPKNYSAFTNRGVSTTDFSGLTLEMAESIKVQVQQIIDYNTAKLADITPRTRHKFEFCCDCGKLHLRDGRRLIYVEAGQDRYICADCARAAYRCCSGCNTYKKRNLFKRVTDQYFCLDCFHAKFYICSRCDHIFTLGDERLIPFSAPGVGFTNQTLCRSCAAQVRSCSTCGHNFFGSDHDYALRRGLCAQCYSDRGSIKQYNYKPSPRWKCCQKEEKMAQNTLFAGFEWELENRSGRDSTNTRSSTNEMQAEKITELMGEGFCYYKRDGSLSTGFEVVTHPFTWRFYKNNREKFTQMVHEAYKNGMRAERSCGFHIHMSKNAFSYGQLYKFIKFVYYPGNRDFINALSERVNETSYAAFRTSDTTTMSRFAKGKHNTSGDRHSAINATGESTVEVRFFASTTNPLSFMKNLEFVFALYEYVSTSSYQDYHAQMFLTWLSSRSNANKYRNLVLWLKDSQIPDHERRKFRKQLKNNKANLKLTKGE